MLGQTLKQESTSTFESLYIEFLTLQLRGVMFHSRASLWCLKTQSRALYEHHKREAEKDKNCLLEAQKYIVRRHGKIIEPDYKNINLDTYSSLEELTKQNLDWELSKESKIYDIKHRFDDLEYFSDADYIAKSLENLQCEILELKDMLRYEK